MIICNGVYEEKVRDVIHELNLKCKVLVTEVSLSGRATLLQPAFGENVFKPEPIPDAEIHIFTFTTTSGSTGAAKVIPHSHAKMVSSMFALATEPHGVQFRFATMQWYAGLFSFLSFIVPGTPRVVTARTFDPEFQAQVIEKYKVTSVANYTGNFQQFVSCIKQKSYDLKSLKIALMAGGRLTKQDRQDLERMVPNCKVVPFYALSETNTLTSNFPRMKAGSVGQPYPNTQIKV